MHTSTVKLIKAFATAKLIKVFAAKVLELSKNPTYRKRIQEQERRQHNKKILDEVDRADKKIKQDAPAAKNLHKLGVMSALPSSGFSKLTFWFSTENFGDVNMASSIVLGDDPAETDVLDAVEQADKDGFENIVIHGKDSELNRWKSAIKNIIDDIQDAG